MALKTARTLSYPKRSIRSTADSKQRPSQRLEWNTAPKGVDVSRETARKGITEGLLRDGHAARAGTRGPLSSPQSPRSSEYRLQWGYPHPDGLEPEGWGRQDDQRGQRRIRSRWPRCEGARRRPRPPGERLHSPGCTAQCGYQSIYDVLIDEVPLAEIVQ